MGWDAVEFDKPMTAREVLEFACEKEGLDADQAELVGDAVYAALGEPGAAHGYVVLFYKDDRRFWTRKLSEVEGPVADDCPARILDMLGPVEQYDDWEWDRDTDGDPIERKDGPVAHARDWRALCRENIALRAAGWLPIETARKTEWIMAAMVTDDANAENAGVHSIYWNQREKAWLFTVDEIPCKGKLRPTHWMPYQLSPPRGMDTKRMPGWKKRDAEDAAARAADNDRLAAMTHEQRNAEIIPF